MNKIQQIAIGFLYVFKYWFIFLCTETTSTLLIRPNFFWGCCFKLDTSY